MLVSANRSKWIVNEAKIDVSINKDFLYIIVDDKKWCIQKRRYLWGKCYLPYAASSLAVEFIVIKPILSSVNECVSFICNENKIIILMKCCKCYIRVRFVPFDFFNNSAAEREIKGSKLSY